MRNLPVLALLVPLIASGCGPTSEERYRAHVAQSDARARMLEALTPEQRAIAEEGAQRDAMAHAACRARAEMAGAAHPDNSLLGFRATEATAAAYQACARFYRTTGIVPQP